MYTRLEFFINYLRARFGGREQGLTIVEYALFLILLVIVAAGFFTYRYGQDAQ